METRIVKVNYLKSIWLWLNGKKNIIANFYWTALSSIIALWCPNGLPPTWNKIFLTVGVILGFVGLGHTAVKRMFPVSEVEK